MRTLTFLFADLRGYTEFVEHHGDVAATTLIGDYRRLVRAEVAKAQGAEVKTEGDSFYVVFQAATDAVRCAISILREAERYSRDRPDRPMRVGVGVHAGEPQPHEGQYVGGAVIVAARLAQQASAGELLISEVVRGLIPKSALPPMQEREGLTLKGIQDAPRIFSVSWTGAETRAIPGEPMVVAIEAAPPADRSMLCPRVVGRETELSALGAFLDEVRGGRGRTVLIAGEAGVGKSAVLRQFLEAAVGAGARVIRGECTEVEARRPFGPFIDAFVSAGVALPAELAQGGPGALPVAEVERYRVHAAFAQILAEASANAAVVAAVEDVHWADSATLELIPYLARKLRDRRVLVLATYRDDELHRLHPLRATLAELKRARLVTEVRLPRLTSDEVAAMIRETLRLGRAPTTAFREAIHDRCEGNPFFIEEVLRALVERGDLEYRDGAWQRTKNVADLAIPDSIRDAVQQRLATLTPTARRALQVAAVVGQRFTFNLVQRVTSIGETDLLGTLRDGIDAQLIHEDADVEEEAYRFRHALTRESVLAELMRRERKLLHLEVAEAIEASAPESETNAEELAYHFDRGADEQRAYRYHEIAARQAERVFAFHRAIEHLERAIELAPRGEPAVGSLQLRLAQAAHAGLDLARAVRAAEAARATFRTAGDVRREGEALTRLGEFRRRAGQTEIGNQILGEALKLLEPLGPSAEMAMAYAVSAGAAAVDERPEGVDLGRKAVEMATQVGANEALLRGLFALGTALAISEHPEEGAATLRDVVRLAREQGSHLYAEMAYVNLAAMLVWFGASSDEIDTLHAERVEHARRHGLVRTDSLLAVEAGRAFQRGEWDEVLRLADEGRSDAYHSAEREILEALVAAARTGPDAGVPLMEAALRGRIGLSPQDIVSRAGSMAAMMALLGDHRATLERAAPLASQRTRHPWVDMGLTAAMWSALELGDRDAALRWADAGATRASFFGHGNAAGCRAFAEGVRAALEGDDDRALERYLASAKAFEDRNPSATQARQARAEILARRGDHAAARAELEAVLPFWRKAKATWYLAQLHAWAAERGIELEQVPARAAQT